MRPLLYGPGGQVVAVDGDGRDAASLLSSMAALEGEPPGIVLQRAAALMTVAFMLCNDLRMSGVVLGEERVDPADAVMMSASAAAVDLGPAWCCDGCGCTALRPCAGDAPCGWAAPRLCTRCARRSGK